MLICKSLFHLKNKYMHILPSKPVKTSRTKENNLFLQHAGMPIIIYSMCCIACEVIKYMGFSNEMQSNVRNYNT